MNPTARVATGKYRSAYTITRERDNKRIIFVFVATIMISNETFFHVRTHPYALIKCRLLF